jgi:hypothetical protein
VTSDKKSHCDASGAYRGNCRLEIYRLADAASSSAEQNYHSGSRSVAVILP